MNRTFLSILLISIAAMTCAIPCGAQWKALGLNPDDIAALGVHDTNLFISAYNAFVLRYAPWDTPYHVVIVDNGITDKTVNSFATIGENLYAGVFSGGDLYRSTNRGENWTRADPWDSVHSGELSILALASSDTVLFAGTDDALFRSTDYGANWKSYSVDCSGIATSGDTILSSDFVSVDRGLTWKRIGPDPSAKVAIIGGVLLAGTRSVTGDARVYRSTNFGLTWDTVLYAGWDITAFARSGSNMFLSTGGFDGGKGAYLSTDSGATWTPVGPNGIALNCIAVQDTMLWAGSSSELYYRPIAQMIGKSSVRELPPTETELTINPNPLTNSATITYSLAENSRVTISVLDALGRVVLFPIAGVLQPAGTYSVGFDGSGLPSGVYCCRLSTASQERVVKFIIGR
jgi:hypothetical protein